MNTPANTPETTTGDKCPHCGAEFKNYFGNFKTLIIRKEDSKGGRASGFKNHFGNFKTPFTRWECLTTSHGSTRSPLCIEREKRQKAEAELAEVKEDNEMMAIRHAAAMLHTQGVVDENTDLRAEPFRYTTGLGLGLGLDGVKNAIKQIAKLEAKLTAANARAEEYLDTLSAIYEKPGIKKQDVGGKKLVSETIVGYMDAVLARSKELKEISEELAETSHVKEYSLIPRFIKAVAKLEALVKRDENPDEK